MSTSHPLRTWWRIGLMGGIPLLAFALGTGDTDARSLERNTGAGAAKKAAVRSAGPDTRQA
ncbi:MAG: hypothetical protein ACRENJ_05945, partial [Candidatus Eiseniibacteriota bacterium]